MCALPANALADGATAIDQLGQLQALAQNYVDETSSDADPLLLALSFTRTGVYNGTLWQLTAGARDLEFESYVLDADESLGGLMGMGTTEMPSGGAIDMGHMLASVNLVYQSVPVAGSWGGDCMELVQQFAGQASDPDGYSALMGNGFAAEDGTSVFGAWDLRADLDSVNIGARLSADSSLSDVMGEYYADLTDYDRAYQFIALSFGTVDTSNTETFRQTVYDTLVNDTGMQLLLYLNGIWSADGGWALKEEYAPALRGATNLLADYLAQAVNGEKVKADGGTRMQTMGGQALSDALGLLGDSDAAAAALAGVAQDAGDTAASAGSTVDGALTEATATLRAGFDATAFQVVMLVVGTAALFGMIVCLILLFARMREQ